MELIKNLSFSFAPFLALSLSQGIATWLTHCVNKRFNMYSARNISQKEKKEQVANMTISIYSFFVSWIILTTYAWIYVCLMNHILKIIAALILLVCIVIVVILGFIPEIFIIPDDFKTGKGKKIPSTKKEFEVNLKSPLNMLRLGIWIAGLFLSLLVAWLG